MDTIQMVKHKENLKKRSEKRKIFKIAPPVIQRHALRFLLNRSRNALAWRPLEKMAKDFSYKGNL